MHKFIASSLVALLVVGTLPTPAFAAGRSDGVETSTPIKHVVIIFQENVSFRSLFCNLSIGDQPERRTALFCFTGDADGERAHQRAADEQSQRNESGQCGREDESLSGWTAHRPRPPIRITITRRNNRRSTTV